MTDRPTPEQILRSLEDEHDGGFTSSPSLRDYDNALAEHGYVIVHPDDVPHPPDVGNMYWSGWNDCRYAIFREATDD